VAASLSLQLLKMPVDAGGATVQLLWHERTAASPAHAWLRALVEDVGRGVAETCKTLR
jgi:hypothetical protein